MPRILATYDAFCAALERLSWLIPILARLVFAGVLLVYFSQSGLSKIAFDQGLAGLLRPTDSAFAQIFPRAADAALYDVAEMSAPQWVLAVAGGWAEILLPVLIVLGLMTRLAALGMIGFVIVQTLTDIFAHGVEIGRTARDAWFDGYSDGLLMDQRAFWIFALAVLVIRGAGPLSLDRALTARRAYPASAA
ncbi:DoxX family protein [Roseovarius spongiae]|uniref:DoxX family protein n=1 Tax=Roseovarius spongiae TaxID=2320272 RepID=A0A3A8AVV4_9RHOB|nr:DoxX family protein [Roseovarius spongiae]RKF16448.1 DoxX family protein [Roseovarius spongiae]